MLKKIGLLKDIAAKVGKKKTMELVSLVESDEPFTVDIKIKKQGIVNKKDVITLKDGQQVTIEYTQV